MNAPTDPTATPDLQARYDVLLRELQRERGEGKKLEAELALARGALGLDAQPTPACSPPSPP